MWLAGVAAMFGVLLALLVQAIAPGSLRGALARKIADGRLAVTQGFLGATADGRTTTLGRNGSDYTASLLAAALAAGHVTVWTDVPGVFTADPGLVAEAYPVTRLTYREALELAHFGTRMFHARTMVPLRDAGIALTIRSTLDPAAPGTRIDADGHGADQQPTCVTSMEGLALVLVEATRSALPPALLAEAHAALDQRGVRVWMTNQTGLGVSASFVVGVAALPVATELLTTLAARSGADVVVTPAPHPVTLVTLVAERMGQHANVAGRFFAALGTIGVRVRAIAQGASERSISCVVDGADTAAAVRAVHAAFHFAEAELHVLLLGHGNCFRDQVLESCPRLSAPNALENSLEGGSLETIRYMVASGAGVAVMPSTAADPLIDKEPMVRVLPFSGEQPSRTVGLVWRVTFPRPQAIDAVRAALLSCQLPGATGVR